MAKWTSALKVAAAAYVLGSTGALAWTQEQLNASRQSAVSISGPIVPGKFIVELQAGPMGHQRDLASRATTLLGEMRSKGFDAEVKTDYSAVSARFQGVSVEIADLKNASIDDIKSIPIVADVWPVYAISLDDNIDTSDPSPQWNPHITTRVDELHKRGYTGKGQRICVVDSGVDASHPALSGKIGGGRNLIDDSDSFEDCLGHGTFVSSVIVGSTKDLTGVAPGSEVYMYKIFACENSVSNDLVLKGLLAADADDCDIISMSVGSDTGYSGSILSRMASEISQDRLVIIAAGNAGEIGPFYASSPASGRGVISVASTDSKQILGWPAMIVSSSGETLNLSYVTSDGAKLNESVVAPLTLDGGDSCNPEQYGSEDQAVIVKRGICFPQKSYNIISSTGFGYYLIYDSYNQGVYYMSDVVDYNPSVRLFALTDVSVGEWVEEQIGSQHTLTLEMEADADTAAFASDRPNAGQVSYFSSWGPSFENDFSPSIAAPGGAVYGAFPDNTYAVGSGTSFSTPYVAGIAALYYAHVKKDHSEFSRRVSSTAALLPAYDAYNAEAVGSIAPLIQQGAGLIDAVKIFDYQTVLISDRQISLNDTDNRVRVHTISLRNTGSVSIVYTISHAVAATVQSRDEELYPYGYYPPLLSELEGSVEVTDSITIPAGSSQDVEVTFNPPANSDEDSGVVWSGKIVFQGDNGEVIAVPYMGVQASTYQWTPLEGAPLVFRYDDVSGYLYPVDWESKPYKPAELDSPEIYFALRYGTYEFSMDLVGEDYTIDGFAYPLTAGPASNQWRGSLRTQPDVYGYYTDFPSKFPLRFNNVGFNTFQSFSNGTEIPSGRYRVLSRALRIFGDESNAEDWQLFLSDPFSIQLNDDPIPGVSTSSTASFSISSTSSSIPSSASTETTTITQSATSSAVTSTTMPSASASSVPGITTTLKAITQPTGLADAFVDLSLYRQNTEESHDLFDTNSWLEIHIQISIPTRLYEGTTVSFALPPVFVDVAEKSYVQSTSALVGTALFDEEASVFTVTFNDWVTWHNNIVGDFYISCRLNPEYQAGMSAGTYLVELATVSKTFVEPLYYRAIDRSRVYESVRELESDDGSQLFAFDVEVPGSVGPWTSVTVVSSQSSGDDGFRCDLTQVNLGFSLDDSNRIAESTEVTNQTVQRCEVKEFRAVYDEAVQTKDVLQFRIINMMGIKGYGSIAMPYSLAIELEDGTSIGYSSRTITYSLISTTRPDYFFSGDIDRDGPIGGGVATSSTMTSTSTTFSASSSLMTTFSTISSAFSGSLTSDFVSTSTSTITSASSEVLNSTITSLSSTGSTTLPSSSSALQTSLTSTISSTQVISATGSSSVSTAGQLTSSSSYSQPGSSSSTTSSASSTFTSSATTSIDSSTVTYTPSSMTSGGSSTDTHTSGSSTSSGSNTVASTSSSTTNGGSSTITYTSSSTTSNDSTTIAYTSSSTTSRDSSTSTSAAASASPPTLSVISSTASASQSSSRIASQSLSSQNPHVSPPLATSITSTVTIITTICTDPSWSAPVTVTMTVPCVTDHQVPITTITSVCTVCASHPVTLTYEQPVLVPVPSDTGKATAVITYGSRTIDLVSVSELLAQPTDLTVPTVANGNTESGILGVPQSSRASSTTMVATSQARESEGSLPSEEPVTISTTPSRSSGTSAPTGTSTVVTAAGTSFRVCIRFVVSIAVACVFVL